LSLHLKECKLSTWRTAAGELSRSRIWGCAAASVLGVCLLRESTPLIKVR